MHPIIKGRYHAGLFLFFQIELCGSEHRRNGGETIPADQLQDIIDRACLASQVDMGGYYMGQIFLKMVRLFISKIFPGE